MESHRHHIRHARPNTHVQKRGQIAARVAVDLHVTLHDQAGALPQHIKCLACSGFKMVQEASVTIVYYYYVEQMCSRAAIQLRIRRVRHFAGFMALDGIVHTHRRRLLNMVCAGCT